MAVSAFDLFKIGIGPSSSHTVGPMRTARLFVGRLADEARLVATTRIRAQLYGSLGATGKGHGSDKAVLLWLMGHEPDTVDVAHIGAELERVRAAKAIFLLGTHEVVFDEKTDLVFYRRETLPFHANGMRFTAFDTHGADLLVLAKRQNCSIAELMRRNERHWRSDAEIDAGLLKIWAVMQACVVRGYQTDGVLPGGFKVKRRAADLHRQLCANPEAAEGEEEARFGGPRDPLQVLGWVNLYALAVNEENAAGGRAVTAPTHGAAGIVPAVLHYYTRFIPSAGERDVIDFLLTAAAIGMLYKENASISGAEVGCQGEVGVACSMAAGALCAVLGGTPGQVENAAEIGMEHHLGLTCDPVGGLVQIPCIERNAIASVKAINAARMALRGDGTHHVSLDKVIKTMRETGADMMTRYKETARGGLAVNIVEC